MDFFKIIVVGIIQAITEFLPISSSGHMNLFKFLFHLPDGIYLDVFFNTATLFSVIFYFRHHLLDFLKKIPFLFISTLPIVIVTFFYLPAIDSFFFNTTSYLSISFLVTSIFLYSTKSNNRGTRDIDFTKAFILGLVQIIAIAPGVSRSAITISTALLLGLSPQNAFIYSFYMYIPVSVGAFIMSILWPSPINRIQPYYLVAFVISSLIGFLAIRLLNKIIIHKHFWKFSIYTLFISLFSYLIVR